MIYGDSFVELHSFNPAYPPLRFEGADLMRIRVLGLVKNTLKNPRSHRIAPVADNGIGKIAELIASATDTSDEIAQKLGQMA